MRQARDDQLPLSLIRFELDHAERLSEMLSLLALQDLHVKVANLLRGESRDCDIPARLSEHGFALILPGLTSDWALPVADNLRGSLAELCGTGCRVTASFGVATMSPGGSSAQLLEGLRIRRRAGSDRWWRSRGPSRGRCRGWGPRLTGCQAQSSSMISSESSMTTGIKGSNSSCLPALEGGAMMSCSDEETTISRGEGSGKSWFNTVPAAAGGD